MTPARSQKLFIWIPYTTRILRYNNRNLRVLHKVRIFMIDQDELGTAVLKDIRDFVQSETGIDGTYHCAGRKYPMVRL